MQAPQPKFYSRNGSLSMASHYEATQIKAEVLRMHSSLNYASCMTSRSLEPHRTTHKAMPNVNDLTLPCTTCCEHYLQRRKENGRNTFQNCCMPTMWYHMPQRGILVYLSICYSELRMQTNQSQTGLLHTNTA